jgi:hypothetical protein
MVLALLLVSAAIHKWLGAGPGKGSITLKGWAVHINGRPAILNETTGAFFITGILRWHDEWLHRRIIVTGALKEQQLNGKKSALKYIECPIALLRSKSINC